MKVPFGIICILVFFTVAASVWAQKPVTPEDDPSRPRISSESSLDLLSGSSRDLSAPVRLGNVDGDPTRKQVLIYYANETSADETGEQNLRTLSSWLNSSAYAEVRALADGIEKDAKHFGAAVEQEIESLKAARRKQDAAKRAAVLIITNALAREGQMLVADTGEEFRTESVVLPKFDDAILQAWPLSDVKSLSTVLAAVAKFFPPSSHEYVLVTKSHGNKHFALTTRVALDTHVLDRDRVIAKLEADADQQMKKFRQEGRPLLLVDGAPVKLESGGAIYVRKGALRAEKRGILRLKLVHERLLLVDREDEIILTTDARPILLRDGVFVVDGQNEAVKLGDELARISVVLGPQQTPIFLATLDVEARKELFAVSSQQPLVGSPTELALLFKEDTLQKPAGTLAPGAEDTLQKPAGTLAPGAEDTLQKPAGTLAPGAEDTLQKPAGTLAPGAEDTLQKLPGTLAPGAEDTLGVASDAELDPNGEFGVDSSAKPLVYYRGVTKPQFVGVLLKAGKSGQEFPLLFAESCRSQFGFDVATLNQAQVNNVGCVWTSDLHGLRYTTIDYTDVFANVAKGQRLSQAMMTTLTGVQRQQQIERAASGVIKQEE
ncbi:hypothetical protein [Lignipirellula cremea]|uniref:Uncharacterized protein n=1 Tax=Lignipirellula cremea TaxID=2528010 RepID=A0A518DRN5_9BACT|nr:hypothetical protein [Lignipirellula cremea]QDU94496.1 hypothetical protein Pla8534_22870 [Lignipirellula cremea]